MFRSVFLKTLFTKRWMILSWTVAIFVLSVFTLTFFPTLSKSLGQALQNIPESLKGFVGDASSYSTITGYADGQIFTKLTYMTIILSVILGTGLLAGDEGDGTLQTLLVQPVSRTRVYLGKLFATVTLIGVACFGLFVSVLVGVLLVHEHIGIGRLAVATGALWLFSTVFGVVAYSLGVITGRRGLAGGLAGGLAFTSLLITSLAGGVSSLKAFDRFSPYHYFNHPGILEYGARWSDMVVLAAIILVFALTGLIVFRKRDIYQR